jgi:hypothetical protein
MSLDMTYGSFGDVITTVQLVHRLAQSLSESRGSAREFQTLVVELRLFENVLQQLMLFWGSRKDCDELQQLANIAKPAIQDCKGTIETFLERAVRKYGRSLLRRAEARKSFWDIIKAIQWNVCEAEEVEKLRDQLTRSSGILQLVQGQAYEIARDLDHEAVSARISALVAAETQADAKLDAQFATLLTEIENGAQALSRVEGVSNAILSTVSTIGNNVLAIRNAVFSIEQAILMLPMTISRLSLFKGNVTYIEDALGWTLPILLDANPSWETVHSILYDQFVRHGSRGLNLVKSRRYAIQDGVTGKDADTTVPFYQVARPGKNYAMSMLFRGAGDEVEDSIDGALRDSICPTCGYTNKATDAESDLMCQNRRCGIIYRKVVDDKPIVTVLQVHKTQDQIDPRIKGPRIKELPDNSDDEEIEEEDTENDHSIVALQESKTMPDDTPDIFKRVRFLTSWLDRTDSRGQLYTSLGDVHLWDTSQLPEVFEAEVQMHVSIKLHLAPYHDYILSARRSSEMESNWTYRFFTGFIGTSIETSQPVLVLIMKSAAGRKRLMKLIQKLEWLGKGSRFAVVTADPTVFREDFDELWASQVRHPDAKWSVFQRESRRRFKALTSA